MSKNSMGAKTWLSAAICLGLWTANLAVAADWSLVPSVTQKSEFNSNLNLDYTSPVSDYIFTLTPWADFNYTTEITLLQGHLGLSGQHYITNSNLDHIDQNYQINGKHQLTPKINLALNSSFIVDTTLQEELVASGVVMNRTPRTSVAASPGVTYNITERLLGTVNYNFNRVMYEDPEYTNYTAHQVSLTFNYLLKNEKTTLTNTNLVRTTLYPGGNFYNTLGIYLGGKHRFTENWDFNLMAGLNINKSSFDTQVQDFAQAPYFITVKQERVTHTKGTPYINVSTTYRWTQLQCTAGLSRDQSATAYGYETNYSRAFASLGYSFTERLTGTLGGDFSLSTQASQADDYNQNYYNLNAQLSYKITEKLSVSPGYRYSQRDDLTEDRSAHAHSGFIMFTYAYPIHYQK